MQVQDEPDAGAPDEPNAAAQAVITATGLGVDGEHGPLFSGIDLASRAGFHAVQMPGGPGQTTLLLTLAGRLQTHPRHVEGARRYRTRARFAGTARSRPSPTSMSWRSR